MPVKLIINELHIGTWKCNYCGFIGQTRQELFNHRKELHAQLNSKGKIKKISWCKGQTKETNPILKQMSENFKQKVAQGLIIPSQTGRPLSEEHKKAISESMKKAHAEGRAHNIGNCRWNNQPSYPEKFFIEVIQNEFSDKNYKREFPFYGFSLDFAWPEKMKCIEIDGEQHTRFEEYKERDKRKDEILKNKNWKCLRIIWKDMFNDSKKWIQIAKDFIDS